MNARRFASIGPAAAMTATLAWAYAVSAQEPPQPPAPSAPNEQNQAAPKMADGRRSADLPIEAYAVVPGTKFLVRLEDELQTGETRQNRGFRVRTLEPLEAGNGIYLPAGAEIAGHVSRVQSAGIAGRARIWLTFDDINTRFGKLPIVADSGWRRAGRPRRAQNGKRG